jgi:hypothetical protein
MGGCKHDDDMDDSYVQDKKKFANESYLQEFTSLLSNDWDVDSNMDVDYESVDLKDGSAMQYKQRVTLYSSDGGSDSGGADDNINVDDDESCSVYSSDGDMSSLASSIREGDEMGCNDSGDDNGDSDDNGDEDSVMGGMNSCDGSSYMSGQSIDLRMCCANCHRSAVERGHEEIMPNGLALSLYASDDVKTRLGWSTLRRSDVRDVDEVNLCNECASYLVSNEKQTKANVWPSFVWKMLTNEALFAKVGIALWSFVPDIWRHWWIGEDMFCIAHVIIVNCECTDSCA